MDCGLLGSPVHRLFQARILEWLAISSSRGSSQARDLASPESPALAGRFFTMSATWEALSLPSQEERRCPGGSRICSWPFNQRMVQITLHLSRLVPEHKAFLAVYLHCFFFWTKISVKLLWGHFYLFPSQ